jgi:hypothetical protein
MFCMKGFIAHNIQAVDFMALFQQDEMALSY